MNREAMEKQLADERALRDMAQALVDSRIVTVAKLELDLAEAEKPELRHGDYGICKSNEHMCLYVKRKNQMELFGERYGSGYPQDTPLSDHKILGNIFDDLKALSEELKEFEVENGLYETIKVTLTGGMLKFRDEDGFVLIKESEIPALILNLRRLIRAAEQEAAKATTKSD